MGFELNYCHKCKVQLAPDDFDGVCSGCDQEDDVTTKEKVVLFECGICDQLHPWGFSGDCRDDANRYSCIEEYAERNQLMDFDFEIRSMCDRLAADVGKERCPSDPPHPDPEHEVN